MTGYLNGLASEITSDTLSKGFEGTNAENIHRKLLLIVGELTEAQEELRSGHGILEVYYKDGKPEGFPVELADALIRILQTSGSLGIDMDAVVKEKMAYNATRPVRHGRLF